MTDENIINKIQKLLELADETRGGTEAERELATKRAQEMMHKYNLQQSEIHGKSAEGDVEQEGQEVSGATAEWKKDLLLDIAAPCFVLGYYVRTGKFSWKVNLVGRPDNIAFVNTLYSHLVPALEQEALAAFNLAHQEDPDVKPRSFRRAFYQHAALVIRVRLEQERARQSGGFGTDLVRDEMKANKGYLDENDINLGRGKSGNYGNVHGKVHGQFAGARADLTPGRKLKS